jgi:hypothetical protein
LPPLVEHYTGKDALGKLEDPHRKLLDRIHEIKACLRGGAPLYRQHAWAGAEECFHFLKKTTRATYFPETECRVPRGLLPREWDGVFKLTVKQLVEHATLVADVVGEKELP